MTKNFGFIPPQITADNWVLGSVLEKKVLQPDRNWKKYLPKFEHQSINFETWTCVAFGTLNAYEALLKRLFGKEFNFSERFVAILAKIREPGSDPHHVSEVIRKHNSVPQEKLPMPATYKEFLQPDPMDQALLDEASEFGYELRHSWLWTGQPSKEEKRKLLNEALLYSPVGISVTAWYRKGNTYVDKGQVNNHWVLLYAISDKGYEIYDSYNEEFKTLSFDHNIMVAKSYLVVEKEAIRLESISIIKALINIYQSLINLISKPNVLNQGEVKQSNGDILYRVAKAHIGQNLAPGMEILGCAITISALWNKAFPHGQNLRFVNTSQWLNFMRTSGLFEEIDEPEPDSIMVYATNEIPYNSPVTNGHIFVTGRKKSPDGSLYTMSNNSFRGILDTHWTVKTAHDYYNKYGKIPRHCFRLK